jgi:hypothetical protein
MIDLSFSRNGIASFIKNKINKETIVAVEIGVLKGDYTQTYYSDLKNSKLYLVDLWETYSDDGYISGIDPGGVEKGYEDVVRDFGNDSNVKICKGFSKDWAAQFEDEYFDWIYIDADHSKKAVLEDLNCWYPKLKKGGAISGHDFLPNPHEITHYFGVDAAVEDFFGSEAQNVQLTNEQYYKSWIYFKPTE